MNYKWPHSKEHPEYAPWYVISWRAIWMPIVYGGLSIAWFGVLLANGYDQACYFWRHAT